MDLMDTVDNMDNLTFLSLFCPPNLKRHKKTGTEEKFPHSGILWHKEKLFFLVTQQFELLFALVLGDFFAPFFLQVTHFFTFLHYTVC